MKLEGPRQRYAWEKAGHFICGEYGECHIEWLQSWIFKNIVGRGTR